MGNCTHCGKFLDESQFTQDRQLKSCPRCSVNDGREHIFYSYPTYFGVSHARITVNTPDGAQSHCSNCRSGNFGPHGGAIRCSRV